MNQGAREARIDSWERLSVLTRHSLRQAAATAAVEASNFRYVFALNTVVNWRLISHVQVPKKVLTLFSLGCSRRRSRTSITPSTVHTQSDRALAGELNALYKRANLRKAQRIRCI